MGGCGGGEGEGEGDGWWVRVVGEGWGGGCQGCDLSGSGM